MPLPEQRNVISVGVGSDVVLHSNSFAIDRFRVCLSMSDHRGVPQLLGLWGHKPKVYVRSCRYCFVYQAIFAH